MICPVCNGVGDISKEANTVLRESFDLLNTMVDALSDDMEIDMEEARKIRDAAVEFVNAYNKMNKRKGQGI